MNESQMTEAVAISYLEQARKAVGRCYKRAVRLAWFNGDYVGVCLGHISGPLQQIRNAFGPSWLDRQRLGISEHSRKEHTTR